MMLANGECEGCSAEREAEVAEATKNLTLYDTEEALEFSSVPCGACHSHKAGSRFKAVRLELEVLEAKESF